MTTEEKAKAYDKALSKAREYHFQGQAPDKLAELESIFPELRESEDKRIWKSMIRFLESEQAEGMFTYEARQSWISYLEKQKEQESAEWNEEDADILNGCISSIEEAKENRYAYKETDGDTSYDREIDWLKSLRPQPHWKPSEEQIGALKDVAYGTYQNGDGPVLRSLYDDLKKLGVKEEPEYYQHFDPNC